MTKIAKVTAREILDSRGNPTVQAKVVLENGIEAVASVPSGASTGATEAHELRDGDKERYGGKGVLGAVEHVNGEIYEAIAGLEAGAQAVIDSKMNEIDGTPNKSRLGANAILGVSLAVARAAAQDAQKPLYAYLHDQFFFDGKMQLPTPMFNVLNGGQHADSGLSIQEFKVIPKNIATFHSQLQAGSEIFHTLKKMLSEKGLVTSVGDEGGFAPRLESNEYALEIIGQAIEKAGYSFGKDVFLGIDAAANSFYNESEKSYVLEPEGKVLTRENLMTIYREWSEKHHLISIEDGLHEEDWEGWKVFLEKMNDAFGKHKRILIGDDLLTTHHERLRRAIDEKVCNAILIKPNQVGSLSETVETIHLAQQNNFQVIISHRSGETTDTFIADLAVAAGADFIKTGAPNRSERVAKYNRLLEIEDELGYTQ